MTTVVDRRDSSAKGGDPVSRERFMERHKGRIRDAVEKAIRGDNTGMTDIGKGGIDVSVPKEDLHEPSIHHGRGGINERVHPGNKEFVAGDTLPKPKGGGQGGGGNGNEPSTGEGNDDFKFSISEEEFLNVLFDGLGLPNLTKRSAADVKMTKPKYAGIVSTGPQNKLNMPLSFKKKRARISCAAKPYNDEIVALLEEEKTILAKYGNVERFRPEKPAAWIPQKVRIRNLEEETSALKACVEPQLSLTDKFRIREIEEEIGRLQKRKSLIPSWNESTDLKFRFHTPAPVPAAKAVMFCLMDVSGSMDEEKKANAKVFYFLLYRFLKRHYKQTDVVFIRHHDKAEEVDEQKFFYDQASGGTTVSAGLALMQEIMKKRYSGPEWNMYGAQASDGDIFTGDDRTQCDKLMREILPQMQGYFYTEIDRHSSGASPLWQTYRSLQEPFKDNFWMGLIRERKDIWPLFRKFFEKRESFDSTPKQSASAFNPN